MEFVGWGLELGVESLVLRVEGVAVCHPRILPLLMQHLYFDKFGIVI